MKNKKLWHWGILALFVLVVFAGGLLVGSVFHSQLSAFVQRLIHERHVTLKHDNLFTDGADGFLNDLDKSLKLPEELYVVNSLSITFGGDGQIKTIYAYLRGNDRKGTPWQFHVNYNSSASKKMTVWRSEWYSQTFAEEDRLAPLFSLTDGMTPGGQLTEGVWTLEYGGKQTFYTADTLNYLPGDADGDGVQSGVDGLDVLRNGGYVTGFTAVLISPDGDIQSYIMEPEYTSTQQISAEKEAEAIEETKATESWTTEVYNGTMYFFFDEQTGWRLVVTDAALGSRFYVLEKTEDGGSSWEQINTNPFDGNIGLAEGLIFYDANFGYAGLAGASQSYSQLYVTRDGGLTFAKVILPLDTVTDIPELGQSLGFTSADYDYYEMPEQDGNDLFIHAITEKGEKSGLLFKSEDQGVTWTLCVDKK